MFGRLNIANTLVRRLNYDRCVKSKIETYIEGDRVELPQLPYKYDALMPIISKEIMELHHSKHHKAYVDNYNKAMEKYHLEFNPHKFDKLLQAVNFHGGGHLNHKLFWQNLRAPQMNNMPGKNMLKFIERDFGSIYVMKAELSKACNDILGAGWGWLAMDPLSGTLSVESTPDQVILQIKNGKIPLMGIDVWEHAYLLQYGERKDYIDAIFDVLNWDFVEQRYKELVQKYQSQHPNA